MNKLLHLLFISLGALLFVSCAQQQKDRPIVTVSIEPQRFLAEQLVGDLYDVNTFVPAGANPETYDPTPARMASVGQSDLFFAIGELGYEQAWVPKLRRNFPQVRFVKTAAKIPPVYTSWAHGDHFHEGVDPHVWSSPKAVTWMIQEMYVELCRFAPEHKETFTENHNKLIDYIETTHQEIYSILQDAPVRSFIIYHPTLTYFARDYNFTQHCIEMDGKEPSPEILKQLINTAREEGIQVIFIQAEFDQKNAETISLETGCRLVVINPLSYNWKEELLKIANALVHE